MNVDQKEPKEAWDELDSFKFFTEHDNTPSQHQDAWAVSSTPAQHDHSSDLLDGLFSYPVQEFLMREDTPEKITSTSLDSACLKPHVQKITSCERVLSGLHSLSSVEIPPDLLSDSEGPGDHLDLPIIGSEDSIHEEGSSKNKRKQGSQLHSIPPPYSGPTLRSRSREVTPIPAPRRFATRSSSRSSTIKEKPKVPLLSPKKAKGKNSSGRNGSRPKLPAQKKATPRKSQSTAIVAAPEHEVSKVHSHDVLFGKGGRINVHKGNLEYHQAKKSLQGEYLHPFTSKARKRELVCQLYNTVVCDWGGRFLRRGTVDEKERWFEAHEEAALEKCRQALATPERTKEERAARRRMFIEKRQKRLGKK